MRLSICNKCFDRISMIEIELQRQVAERFDFVSKNAYKLFPLLQRCDKNLWKKLFGDYGLETLENILNEYEKYEKIYD